MPQVEPLEGSEPIALDGRELATVLDFWRWAYSNLNDNASRGRFAEYIVCAALGCSGGTRTEWDSYDIDWDGVKVEVKSSAYIQSWAQKELSRIAFGIQPTLTWNAETGEYGQPKRRQADVYVFCIENCREQGEGKPNPIDLSQWEFRVVSTTKLDELGEQKTISLPQLDSLGAEKVGSVFDLPDAVRRAVDYSIGR